MRHHELTFKFSGHRHEYIRSRRKFNSERPLKLYNRWTSPLLDFELWGRDGKFSAGRSYRIFSGPDWIALYHFSNMAGVRDISGLRIRGNREAAEEALMHAYLKLL